MQINLNSYDIIIINTSGGKDSSCAVYEICRMAKEQGFPREKIIASHQDLGLVEWQGVKDLVLRQSAHFGIETIFSKRRDQNGYEETLLEYAERRRKWPSNAQRWCTSDYKRGPGARVVTALTKNHTQCKVLYVFGFRKDESPARSKKKVLKRNHRLTTKKRIVDEYLPIHTWDVKRVWKTIKEHSIPYHFAYDLGMPRLSCVFCIFSPFDALVVAGKANPELLDKYIAVEEKIGHTFKKDFAIKEVREAIQKNYQPKKIADWVM